MGGQEVSSFKPDLASVSSRKTGPDLTNRLAFHRFQWRLIQERGEDPTS